jgi:hypothetical protein
MRLLKLDSHGALRITKDLFDNIPPYAILSHTWEEDDEEVTFEDISKGSGKDKAGYRKIEFCRKQAARDGLHHFWVDSCCIDKSSSTELSEAINSMFRWYRRAARCYVYLTDVSADDCSQVNQPLQWKWEPAFRNSRWFTRGWTLQELIAPQNVDFFSREGQKLGCKRSLGRQIHEITGIPTQALHESSLSGFSVEERLSWAERRQTKREEDAAYSLLGIFDIHMPLIYGEGKRNAMGRLSEQLKKHSIVEARADPSTSIGPWSWLTSVVGGLYRWIGQFVTGKKPVQTPKMSQATGPDLMPRSITQAGSEYRGPVTVSGGQVFQGNYVGLGHG